MTRGLTAGEITALEAKDHLVEEHLRIKTRRSNVNSTSSNYAWIDVTTYRYTTGGVDTVVSGDGTYIPQSYITNFEYSQEGYELIPSTLSIVIETFDQTFIDSITTEDQFSTLVDMWKVFKNPTTLAVDARFTVFSGSVTGIDLVGGVGTQTVTIHCSSIFNQFTQQNGRTLGDLEQVRLYQTVVWGSLQV